MGTMNENTPPVTCDPVRLANFIHGDLPQAEMERMLAHLDECPACQKVFEDMVRLRAAAPEIRQGLSEKFFRFGRSGSPLRRWVWMYGAAAAVLGGLVVGLFVMRGWLERRADPLAEALETRPFEYVSPVMRGPETPAPDPRREAMMERYRRGEYEAFAAESAAWLRARPDDAQVMFFAGVAAYLEHKDSIAEVYLAWNLETDRSRRPEAVWYLANTLLRQRKYAEARPLLEELVRQDHPYSSPSARLLALMPPKTAP
jgi:hypothetical protein